MRRLSFTTTGLADSRDILLTLTEIAGQPVAAAYFARFRATLERLRSFPESGGPRPRLGPGIRIAVVRPYVIFYRASDAEVLIVRVLHGRRRITRQTVRAAL